MKVIKNQDSIKTVTLRLPEKLLLEVDNVAERNELSRQELVAAILKQVMSDPKFILRVQED